MTNFADEIAGNRRRIVVLDPARAHASESEKEFTQEVVRLLDESGWAVDWHVDCDDDLSAGDRATVWRTLYPAGWAELQDKPVPDNTTTVRKGAGRTHATVIAGRIASRIAAMDMWARTTWHAANKGILVRLTALLVWVIVRIFYKLQRVAGWCLRAVRHLQRLLTKHLFWTLLYPYVLKPAGRASLSAHQRRAFPALEFFRRAGEWIYWRTVFVILVEPARNLAKKIKWRIRHRYALGVHRSGAVHRDGSRRSNERQPRPEGSVNDEEIGVVPATAMGEHAIFTKFGVWLKEREKAAQLPDLILMPAVEVWHLEALLGLAAQLQLDNPLPIKFVAVPAQRQSMRDTPGLADRATLKSRLQSGSPFHRITVLTANGTDGSASRWNDISTVQIDRTADHLAFPAPEAVAGFVKKIREADAESNYSLVVDSFGPIAIVSSAFWGRVGSSAIFDAQVRVLIELGFRVARLYFDHWPNNGARRVDRIRKMIGQDQAVVRPHYFAIMERDEHNGLNELKSTAEFRSASALKRMSMLLANAVTETPKLVDWIGRTAKVAIVNHAPHVEATRSLTNAPIILETHDIYSHLLDIHGVPGFVPSGPDGPALRLEQERAIWKAVDCCVNLSESEQREIADFALRSVFVRPIRNRSTPSDRPWLQFAKENNIACENGAPGFFDIMLWGSWHENNVQSIRWFLEKVRPRLEKRRKLRIVIVGRVLNGLRPYIRKYPDVVCCEFVDRLEDIAIRSSVLVLPDRKGTGISIKAMDVLGWSACFSSTKQGMRGVEFGRFDSPVTETAEEMAADILELLDEHSKREARRELAQNLHELNSSQDAYFEAWQGILRDVLPGISAGFSGKHRNKEIPESGGQAKNAPSISGNTSLPSTDKHKPWLSVVVATCDRYETLPDTIRSLTEQNVPPGFLEVIVVDHSPDQDFAAAVAERYSPSPHLNYILEPASGQSNARNLGLSKARADIVAFVDDNAIADPNWASEIVATFHVFDGSAGVVGGPVLARWIGPQPTWLPDELVKYLSVVDWEGTRRELDSDKRMSGCNIAYKKTALQSVGGFSNTLEKTTQDQFNMSNGEAEVEEQLRQQGYLRVYTPEAKVSRVIDPERLDRRGLRRQSAWQAVSDFLKDAKGPADGVQPAGQRLRQAQKDRNPPLPLHFFRQTDRSELVRQDVGLIYDLVSVMLVGGVQQNDETDQENGGLTSMPPLTSAGDKQNRTPGDWIITKPRLSVVIATYDRYDLLPYALASLQSQTMPPEQLEIIVVDNSPDKRKASAFAERFDDDPQITYIIADQPGLSNARNIGLETARSDYVAYIDDDALAATGWAVEVLAAFEAFGKRTAVVGGRVRPHWLSQRPDWLADHLLSYLSVVDWGDKSRRLKSTEWLVGCNIAFDKAALVSAGGFSAGLGRIGPGHALLSNEDNDVVERLTADGRLAIYAPAAEVEHVIDPGRLRRGWFRRRAAWQAVSDFVQDADRTIAYAPAAAEHLRHAHGNDVRQDIAGIFAASGQPEAFEKEVGLCYDIVVSLLNGGEEFDLSGMPAKAPSVRSKLRGRARRAILANKELTRLARKVPHRFR
ncbi:glycosyltransferase [Hoeflea sp.]|uniref:glycosyltransferase n=1 Tax=Hoeflea sp. TaxID=1940281 RepID=UPI003B011FA3